MPLPPMDRRAVLIGSSAVALTTAAPAAAPPFAWQNVAPTDAGFTAETRTRLDTCLGSGRAPGLHSVVVVRERQIALERYFEGEDNNWGRDLGRVQFG